MKKLKKALLVGKENVPLGDMRFYQPSPPSINIFSSPKNGTLQKEQCGQLLNRRRGVNPKLIQRCTMPELKGNEEGVKVKGGQSSSQKTNVYPQASQNGGLPLANSAVRGNNSAKKKTSLDQYHSLAASVFDGGQSGLEDCFINSARDGDYDRIETVLLRRNEVLINVDVRDQGTGNTALIWAAKRGHVRIVEILLKHGVDITLRNYDGQTAFELASPQIRQMLLESVDKGGQHRNLLQAAWQGNAKLIKKIVEEGKRVDINCRNGDGLTPLLLATRDVHLFERSGDRNGKSYNPLDVVEELLINRADPNSIDEEGKTPLHHLSSGKALNAKQLVQLLLTEGSDLDVRDRRCFTPIHCASQSGNDDVVEALLSGGADANARGFAGTTPLHISAINGHDNVAITLLRFGADVTIVDDSGHTPVDVAKTKKVKATLKQAWTEATQRKIERNLGPVRPPSRDSMRLSSEFNPSSPMKKPKGEVIFDGDPVPSEGSPESTIKIPKEILRELYQRHLSLPVSQAADGALTPRKPPPMMRRWTGGDGNKEQQIMREVISDRFSPLTIQRENSRVLGGRSRSQSPARVFPARGSGRGSSLRSLSPMKAGGTPRKQSLPNINTKPTLTKAVSDPSPSCKGEMNIPVTILGLDLDDNLQEVRVKRIYQGPTNAMLKKSHHRNMSDPYAEYPASGNQDDPDLMIGNNPSSGYPSSGYEDWSDSSAAPSQSGHASAARTPSGSDRSRLRIPDTIEEGKIAQSQGHNLILNLDQMQIRPDAETPTTGYNTYSYPTSKRLLPPTPTSTQAADYSALASMSQMYCDDSSKESSPRSDDEELDSDIKTTSKVTLGKSLLKTGDFNIDESRVKDSGIESDAKNSSSNRSSFNSSSSGSQYSSPRVPESQPNTSAKTDSVSQVQSVGSKPALGKAINTSARAASSTQEAPQVTVSRNGGNTAAVTKAAESAATAARGNTSATAAKLRSAARDNAAKHVTNQTPPQQQTPVKSAVSRNRITVHSNVLSDKPQTSVPDKTSNSDQSAQKNTNINVSSNSVKLSRPLSGKNFQRQNSAGKTGPNKPGASSSEVSVAATGRKPGSAGQQSQSKTGNVTSRGQDTAAANAASSRTSSGGTVKKQPVKSVCASQSAGQSSVTGQNQRDVKTVSISGASQSAGQSNVTGQNQKDVKTVSVSAAEQGGAKPASSKVTSDKPQTVTRSGVIATGGGNVANKPNSAKTPRNTTNSRTQGSASSTSSRSQNLQSGARAASSSTAKPVRLGSSGPAEQRLRTGLALSSAQQRASNSGSQTSRELSARGMQLRRGAAPEKPSSGKSVRTQEVGQSVPETNKENTTKETSVKDAERSVTSKVTQIAKAMELEPRSEPKRIVNMTEILDHNPVICDPFESIKASQEAEKAKIMSKDNSQSQRVRSAKSASTRQPPRVQKQVSKDKAVEKKPTSAGRKKGRTKETKEKSVDKGKSRPRSSKKTKKKKTKRGQKTQITDKEDISKVAFVTGQGWYVETDCNENENLKLASKKNPPPQSQDVDFVTSGARYEVIDASEHKHQDNLYWTSGESSSDEYESDFEMDDLPGLEPVLDQVVFSARDYQQGQNINVDGNSGVSKVCIQGDQKVDVEEDWVPNPANIRPKISSGVSKTTQAIEKFSEKVPDHQLDAMLNSDAPQQHPASAAHASRSAPNTTTANPSKARSSAAPRVAGNSSAIRDNAIDKGAQNGKDKSWEPLPKDKVDANQNRLPPKPFKDAKPIKSSSTSSVSNRGNRVPSADLRKKVLDSPKLSSSKPSSSNNSRTQQQSGSAKKPANSTNVVVQTARDGKSSSTEEPRLASPQKDRGPGSARLSARGDRSAKVMPEDEELTIAIDEIIKNTPNPSLTITWNSQQSVKSEDKQRLQSSSSPEEICQTLREKWDKDIDLRASQKFKQLPVRKTSSVSASFDSYMSFHEPDKLEADQGASSDTDAPSVGKGKIVEGIKAELEVDVKSSMERQQFKKLVNSLQHLELKVDSAAQDDAKRSSLKVKARPAQVARAIASEHLPEKSPRFIRKHDTLVDQKSPQEHDHERWETESDVSLPASDLSCIMSETMVPKDGRVVTSRLGRAGSSNGRAPSRATNELVTDDEELIQWKKGNMLGKGAYGTVWCGLTNQGELIAVKQIVLNTNDMEKAEAEYEKIQEEVAILKNLKHINIVSYHGTSLDDNIVSIFMQFVPGGSIANILARFGALEEEVFCHYTKQILDGVEYLHANGVIHRDIKGGNIMVMHDGEIKLIDFGCAKRLCLNVSVSQKRLLKSMKGTPYWMAPEVISETGYGTKSDIWSIGCTVFEMATRKPPWADMPPMTAIFAIGADKPVPQMPEKFSSAARNFVFQCLTRNPDLRPSATDLLSHPFIVKRARKKTTLN